MSTMPGPAGSRSWETRRNRGRPRRILFLDDDPGRALVFVEEFPDAVWVETVEDCLVRLEESWDEVHLDHDLGGEHFVDCGREDCGMAIVRWLCLEPRPQLANTQFYVHSHNPTAATLMVFQMQAAGYRVEGRPFGARRSLERPPGRLDVWREAFQAWLSRLRGSRQRPPGAPPTAI